MSKREREPGEVEPLVPNDDEPPPPAKKVKLTHTILVTQTGTDWYVSIPACDVLEADYDPEMCAWFESSVDRDQEQWRLELPAKTCNDLQTLMVVFVELLARPRYTLDFDDLDGENMKDVAKGESARDRMMIAKLLAYCNCFVMLRRFEQVALDDLVFLRDTCYLIHENNRKEDAITPNYRVTLNEAYEWARTTNNKRLMTSVTRMYAVYPEQLTLDADVRKDLWTHLVDATKHLCTSVFHVNWVRGQIPLVDAPK